MTNSMEQRPSWEAKSAHVDNKFPNFKESEGSLQGSQGPESGSYPKP
jgi:hypothetical protein